MSKPIYVLLYYKFVQVDNPEFEVMQHKLVCKGAGLLGRVIIANEGINGTVAGTRSQLKEYVCYMDSHPLFSDIVFKWSYSERLPFHKLIVKVRPEIVTLGKEVDMGKTGKHVKPQELHKMLEAQEDVVMVDMRNNYEYEVGRFKNAVQPGTNHFFELPAKLENLGDIKSKKIVTYCTGGVRCEKASALLTEEGYEDAYQLEGGIVKYLEQFPDGHFEGKNFVFDDRLITNKETKSGQNVLSVCEHCKKPSDRYIDCAKPDCHQLFICCKDCDAKSEGLCPVAVKHLAQTK